MANGPVSKPLFGQVPEKTKVFRHQKFAYADLLETVRHHPNCPAIIATFDQGTPKDTAKRIRIEYSRITLWLKKHYPLEDWAVMQRKDPDKYTTRHLWVEFKGVMTPAEAARKREANRQVYLNRLANAAERRRGEEAKARVIANQMR